VRDTDISAANRVKRPDLVFAVFEIALLMKGERPIEGTG
jgi:hypothetical protein